MSLAKSLAAVGSETSLHLVAQGLQAAHGPDHDLEFDNFPLAIEADHVDALELTIAHPGAELEDHIHALGAGQFTV